MNNSKKFNKKICTLRFAKNGNLMSKVIDKELFDAIQGIELGGRLVIRVADGNPQYGDSQIGYMELISKEDVDAYSQKNPRTGNASRMTGPSTPVRTTGAGSTDDVI